MSTAVPAILAGKVLELQELAVLLRQLGHDDLGARVEALAHALREAVARGI